MKKELNLPMPKIDTHRNYNDEELIDIMKRFINANGFFPSYNYWEKESSRLNLPSPKTYIYHFNSWHNIKKICGYNDNYIIFSDGKYRNKYNDKDSLIQLVNQYYYEYNKTPTVKELKEYACFDISHCIRNHFKSFKDLILESNCPLNTRRKYTDKELDDAFLGFVKKYGRVPTVRDYIWTKELPCVKPYISRFGSWANACKYYGFVPNRREPEYYMSNGEKCDTSYEYMVSSWLIKNHIPYDRNILYKNIDNDYNGLMNCDYLIYYNNKKWYVEIAGMLLSKDYIPTTDETKRYYKKLKQKEEMLINNNLNYKIIYANDFKEVNLDKLLSFL